MKERKNNKVEKIIAAILMAFLMIPSFGQVDIGIKGGVNASILNIGKPDKNDYMPGFNLGLVTDFYLDDNFSIRPEFLYVTKGVKSTWDAEILNFDIAENTSRLKTSYFQVPIYFVVHISDYFNIHVGPYASLLLDADVEADGQLFEEFNFAEDKDVDRDQFNKIDAGLTAGIGFSFDPVFIGASYDYGLRDVGIDDEISGFLVENAKNETLRAYIGVKF